jgi:hypothetical protein
LNASSNQRELSTGINPTIIINIPSIKKINNDKGYTKENCRWVTNTINCNNTRRNKYITHNGVKLSYSQWSKILGGGRHLVSDRIRIGWEEIAAVTKPPRCLK